MPMRSSESAGSASARRSPILLLLRSKRARTPVITLQRRRIAKSIALTRNVACTPQQTNCRLRALRTMVQTLLVVWAMVRSRFATRREMTQRANERDRERADQLAMQTKWKRASERKARHSTLLPKAKHDIHSAKAKYHIHCTWFPKASTRQRASRDGPVSGHWREPRHVCVMWSPKKKWPMRPIVRVSSPASGPRTPCPFGSPTSRSTASCTVRRN